MAPDLARLFAQSRTSDVEQNLDVGPSLDVGRSLAATVISG
jgi:hypothetical protein